AGELVESRAPVVLGRAPLGADPALLFQPLEGGIEGAVIHQNDFERRLLNGTCDALAVLLAERERAEDQEVEGTLQQIGAAVLGRHTTRIYAAWVECQQEEEERCGLPPNNEANPHWPRTRSRGTVKGHDRTTDRRSPRRLSRRGGKTRR